MSTDEQQLEAAIQAAGKTAPRVTPDQVDASIASIHFFTAAQGDAKALEDAVFAQGGVINAAQSRPVPPQLGLLTLCVLVLQNGYTVTGESACADPANFDPDIGKNIAFDNARKKIWPLLGFRLRDQLQG